MTALSLPPSLPLSDVQRYPTRKADTVPRLSSRHIRMIQQFHTEQGVTFTTEQYIVNAGCMTLSTPDGRRWVLVDTELGLWYTVWRGQSSSLPKVRSEI